LVATTVGADFGADGNGFVAGDGFAETDGFPADAGADAALREAGAPAVGAPAVGVGLSGALFALPAAVASATTGIASVDAVIPSVDAGIASVDAVIPSVDAGGEVGVSAAASETRSLATAGIGAGSRPALRSCIRFIANKPATRINAARMPN
jgi:hypothetical protein